MPSATELESLTRLLDERTADVARVSTPPAEKQLSLRHAGEDGLPSALIRQRREAEASEQATVPKKPAARGKANKIENRSICCHSRRGGVSKRA